MNKILRHGITLRTISFSESPLGQGPKAETKIVSQSPRLLVNSEKAYGQSTRRRGGPGGEELARQEVPISVGKADLRNRG